jgi:hypothetical protein
MKRFSKYMSLKIEIFLIPLLASSQEVHPYTMNLDTTLDIANAFLSPGVYIRAELVPSHQPYARNGALARG